MAHPRHSVSEAPPERLVFLDALRVTIVLMVVVHHAAQPYGPTGGNWPVTDTAQSEWFRSFYDVNAAIGLGLLFLVAGYFAASSYERKGLRRFARERWARIGKPLVLFALLVHLPMAYLAESRPAAGAFLRSLYEDGWVWAYLHLWFLGHLLLYSAAFLVVRQLANRAGRQPRTWPLPHHAAIAAFVVGLALVTWIVRWWYSIDEWVPLLFLVAAEPARMPQYVSLFTLGVMAFRGDWLRRIPARTGAIWLAVGLIGTAGIVAVHTLAPSDWNYHLLADGGVNWPSLLRSTLEALICAGLSVGLVVLFRETIHRPGRLLVAAAGASYGAYILHPFLLVILQLAILEVTLPAAVKFTVVAVFGVLVTFGAAHLSGKVPGLRVLLGAAPQRPRSVAPADRGPVVPQ